jgi:Bacterial Ig-like domain
MTTISTTTKRFALLLALMAATLLATIMVVYVTTAHPAQAVGSVAVDTSPGTAAPPATLGPYTMTPFAPDNRDLGLVGTVPAPQGNLLFNQQVIHRRIGQGWSSWSHGYSGDVYGTGGATILDLIPPVNTTTAFYFYAEPNPFGVFNITATASDGTTSGPIQVQSQGGAKYFGFYSTDGTTLRTIRVESTEDFAVGEFGIAYRPKDTTPPTVKTSTPTNNADDITATFSEPVQNVSTSTFILERKIASNVKTDPPKYVRVDATVTPSADGISAVLNPVEDLPKGDYRATITTEVTDQADPANPLKEAVVWSFTVRK